MYRVKMFVVLVGLMLAATGASKAGTGPEPRRLDHAAGVTTGQSLFAAETGVHGFFQAPAAEGSRLAELFVVAGMGRDDDDHPLPRSHRCPDQDDHHQKLSYDDDHKDGGKDTDKDKDKDKDKDHDHGNCGKGDDDKNP